MGKSSTLDLRILSKSITVAVILVLSICCAQLGPDLVKAGRNNYNIVLQQTEDAEVILNLARVRYPQHYPRRYRMRKIPMIMDIVAERVVSIGCWFNQETWKDLL